MSVIKELIRTEADGTISFGDYSLDAKAKAEDFEHEGDLYKVKTYCDITKLERNGMFVYESVPGTAVSRFYVADDVVTFQVEGVRDAQITVQMEDDMEIYTSGATNIFKYPELSDSERASELISAFEDKKELANLINESLEEENSTGIQVYIGNEAPIRKMRDCSVVTATYELGEGVQGTIGIIGPKRMDYEKVVDSLKTLKSQLDTIFERD